MDFEQNMKNYTGIVLILLLLVIFTQAKTFNFFINTYLGRILLIIILLIASYCNKIFGVVIVLLIIIVFNNISLTEGMTNKEKNEKEPSKENNETKTDDDRIISKNQQHFTPGVETNSDMSNTNEQGFNKNKKSMEGFDMIGTENSIQRGKPSNSIHINEDTRSSQSVSGTDTYSLFNNNYSNF